VNARPGSTTAPRQPTPSASASAEAFPRPSKASRLTFKTPAKPRPCSATTSPGSGGRPGRLSIPTPRTASANASKSASSPPSGTHAAARNLPTARREVWITRSQLDRLAEAIQSRYHALVNLAALTGLRWGELAALRWDDVRLDQPLDDGAVAGPGRLRVLRALSDPQPQRPLPLHGPQDRGWPSNDRTGPAKLHHPAAARPAVQRPAAGLVFTTPGGALGPGGPLPTTSAGPGDGHWSRQDWTMVGRSTAGCTSTTCTTRMLPGSWRCGADDRGLQPARSRQSCDHHDGVRPPRQARGSWRADG
jgi:hypothetical protein